ncbi:MAG: hypothetical protein ACR2NL_02630 [Acidimicrobiia bacterium]
MSKEREQTMTNFRDLPERIYLRGRLYPDLEFEVKRSFSSTAPETQSFEGTDGYMLELLDQQGEVVNRGPVRVWSKQRDGEEFAWLAVEGRIVLRGDADTLRFSKGDIVIRHLDIGEQPDLKVKYPDRFDRNSDVELKLEFTEPGEGAYLQVAYGSGRQARILGFYEPARSLAVSLAEMPGGKEAHLSVHYCNGLRSVAVGSDEFEIPEKEPIVRIERPIPGEQFATTQPVELEGSVINSSDQLVEDGLLWTVEGSDYEGQFNESIVAIDAELQEGAYRATLRYGDTSETVEFEVGATSIQQQAE